MSEFDPTCLFDDGITIPYFMDKGKTGHYGKLESGVKWSDYTLQYFSKNNIFEIMDQVIKNRKPIYTGIFGDTGNGKSSLIINFLKYLYTKYSPSVEFTPKTFHHFYWLGKNISLDARIVNNYFRKKLNIPANVDIFLVIDEAEGVISSDRGGSTQNADARFSMDTLRANKIHLIFTGIDIDEIDRRIKDGKLILRIEVLFNNIAQEMIKYNVMVWAKGYYFKNREYIQRKGFVMFAEDQLIPWCEKTFYEAAHDLKKGKIYGDDITAYLESNEVKEFELEQIQKESTTSIENAIIKEFEDEYPELYFDKTNRPASFEIVVNDLLVPIIQKYREVRMEISDANLEGILLSCQNIPNSGIFWRAHLKKARRIADSHTHDIDIALD